MKYLSIVASACALLAVAAPAASAQPNFRAEMIVRPSGRLGVACNSIDNMRKLKEHALAGETTLFMAMKPRYCGDLPAGQYRILSVREPGFVQFESLSKSPFRYSWAAENAFTAD